MIKRFGNFVTIKHVNQPELFIKVWVDFTPETPLKVIRDKAVEVLENLWFGPDRKGFKFQVEVENHKPKAEHLVEIVLDDSEGSFKEGLREALRETFGTPDSILNSEFIE